MAQPPAGPPSTPTRPDVAAIDHDRILAAAAHYLTLAPTPITSLHCERSPGTAHDFYSESDPQPNANSDAPSSPTTKATPPPFTAHRDAVFTLSLAVPALAAAYFLTSEQRYAEHAVLWLRTWFIDPSTSMTPRMEFGQELYSLGRRSRRRRVHPRRTGQPHPRRRIQAAASKESSRRSRSPNSPSQSRSWPTRPHSPPQTTPH